MAYSEPDIPVSSLLRVGSIAVGCPLVGIFLLIRSFTSGEVPTLEKLQQVSGIVKMETGVQISKRSHTEYPVLVMNGQRYKYLHWFPGASELPARVQSGDSISLWTDANDNQWVWQIQRGNETIVPYTAVRDAVASSRRWEPVAGGFLIVLGLGAAILLVVRMQLFSSPEKPRKKETKTPKPAKKKPARRPLKELDEEL